MNNYGEMMTNDAEKIVSKFYNEVGWKTGEGVTDDAKRFEDLRENAQEYVSKCRLRVLRHIPQNGINILDMASGPIQYKEYLEFSKNFKKRYCVDLSSDALDQAKKKIGDHGVFLHGSFFDISLDQNFFDCVVSLHTLYHIDKNQQENVVRKLLDVTKYEKPIVIVYENPASLSNLIKKYLRSLKKSIFFLFKRKKREEQLLYHYVHPLDWWDRFSDIATVEIFPYRSFPSSIQKKVIPNNFIGFKMLEFLFYLEDRFPRFFVKYAHYPLIVLRKRADI